MNGITLPFRMPLTQFRWHFRRENLRPIYFMYQAHLLLFSFPFSDFLLACHPCNLYISAGSTCVLFILYSRCISCNFCSRCPTSTDESICQGVFQSISKFLFVFFHFQTVVQYDCRVHYSAISLSLFSSNYHLIWFSGWN